MSYKLYYWPYTYDTHPYFASNLIKCYDKKYDPKAYALAHPKTVELDDGTIVETFSNTNQSFLSIVVSIFLFIIIYKQWNL
jgi:hypothetical protein